MKLPRDITSLSREELLVLVGQLERQAAQLSASLEGLQAENAQIQGSNKRPGRQPGSRTFSFRQAPKPEEITEPPVEVPAC